MVTTFKRSRIFAFYIGIPLTVFTFIIAWLVMGGHIVSQNMRFVVSLSLAIFVFGTSFLISRAMATRDYQKLLPCFYSELDPKKMVNNLEAIDEKTLNPDEKAANDLHKASGYIYLGETDKADALLKNINIPSHDLNTRFLISGNLATSALMAGETKEARKRIEILEAISKDKRCNQNLMMRIGRVSGYLRMCLNIQKGNDVDISIMIDDFETSDIPTHKLDTAYYIALYMCMHGLEIQASKYISYVRKYGEKTVYPILIDKQLE